jgi:hypothetical protein
MSMNFSFPSSALCLSSPSLRRIGSAKVQTFLLLPNIPQSFFYFFLSITPQKPCKESFITVIFFAFFLSLFLLFRLLSPFWGNRWFLFSHLFFDFGKKIGVEGN